MSSKFPLSRESFRLLREHRQFFDWFRAPEQKPGLQIRLGDAEAHMEREVFPNGDVRVTLVAPIDDNAVPSDGRLYLKDHFVLDPLEKKLKAYLSELSGSDSPEVDEQLRALRTATLPDVSEEKVQAFAKNVAAFYGRPFTSQILKVFKEQQDYLKKHHRVLHAIQENWRIKVVDPQSHFKVAEIEGGILIELCLAMDDDTESANGRMFWVEQFTVDPASGKLVSHQRDFQAARDLPDELRAQYREWEKVLKQKLPADPKEAAGFAQALWPEIRRAVPLYRRPFFEEASERKKEQAGVRRRATLEGLDILEAYWKEAANQLRSKEKGLWYRSISKLGLWASEVEGLKPKALETLFQKARLRAEEPDGTSPLAMLARLELSGEERAWLQHFAAESLSQQIDSASQEIAGIRASTMLRLLRDGLMERGFFESAAILLGKLQENSKVQAMPEIQVELQRVADLLAGKGTIGTKVEYILPRLAEQAAELSALGAMMVAPFGGVWAEALVLRCLGRFGLGGSAASLAGIAGEAAAFATARTLFASFHTEPLPLWKHWGHDVGSAALLFGLTRLAHGTVSKLGKPLARGQFGSWGKADDFAMEFPMAPNGRIFTADFRPILSRSGSRILGALNLVGGVGAVHAANVLSRKWAPLRQDSDPGTGDFFDSILLYFQALVGARLANGLSDGNLFTNLAEMRLRAKGSFKKGGGNPTSDPPSDSSHTAEGPDTLSSLLKALDLPVPKWPRRMLRHKRPLTELYGPQLSVEVAQGLARIYKVLPELEKILDPARLAVEDAGGQNAVFIEAELAVQAKKEPLTGSVFEKLQEDLQKIEEARRPYYEAGEPEAKVLFQNQEAPLHQVFGNEALAAAGHFANLLINLPHLVSVFTPEKLVSVKPGDYLESWQGAMRGHPGRLTEEVVSSRAQQDVEAVRDLAVSQEPHILAEGWGVEEYRERGVRAWLLRPGCVYAAGRNSRALIQLADPQISRNHFSIMGASGQWFLEDKNSMSGTTLAGERLKPHHPVPLADNSSIQAGEQRFRFLFQAKDGALLREETSEDSPSQAAGPVIVEDLEMQDRSSEPETYFEIPAYMIYKTEVSPEDLAAFKEKNHALLDTFYGSAASDEAHAASVYATRLLANFPQLDRKGFFAEWFQTVDLKSQEAWLRKIEEILEVRPDSEMNDLRKRVFLDLSSLKAIQKSYEGAPEIAVAALEKRYEGVLASVFGSGASEAARRFADLFWNLPRAETALNPNHWYSVQDEELESRQKGWSDLFDADSAPLHLRDVFAKGKAEFEQIQFLWKARREKHDLAVESVNLKRPVPVTEWELSGDRAYVGGRIESTDLVIPDPHGMVSRVHFRIQFHPESGEWKLTDLGSSNGTYLNGTKLNPAQAGWTEPSTPMLNGDILGVGVNYFIFLVEGPEKARLRMATSEEVNLKKSSK